MRKKSAIEEMKIASFLTKKFGRNVLLKERGIEEMPIYRLTGSEPPEAVLVRSEANIFTYNYFGKCYVYVLKDAEDETRQVRYVGITGNPFTRLRAHVMGSAHNSELKKWVLEVEARRALTMELLWICATREDALLVEADTIEQYAHPNLFNVGHNSKTLAWENRRKRRAESYERLKLLFPDEYQDEQPA